MTALVTVTFNFKHRTHYDYCKRDIGSIYIYITPNKNKGWEEQYKSTNRQYVLSKD